MNKIILIIILLLIVSFFLVYSLKNSSSLQEKECFDSGGEWKKAGRAGNFMCIHTYADGGKPCTSSDDCISSCIVVTTEKDAFCKYSDNPFGCYNIIEDYRETGSIICVD